MKKGNRIFILCNDGRSVQRTSLVRLSDGTMIEMNDLSVGMIFPLDRAVSKSVEILGIKPTSPPRESFLNSLKNSEMNETTTAGPVQAARQTSGALEATRLETKGNQSGASSKLTVTLTNTGAAAVRHIMFDGFNLNALSQGVAPLPAADFAVAGTFGEETLVVMHTVTRANPIRVRNLHIRSNTGAFVNGGNLRTRVSNISNNSKVSDIVLAGAVKPNQFQQNIIELTDYDQLIDGFVGLDITVAAGETLTLTFDVVGVSEAYNMGNPNS